MDSKYGLQRFEYESVTNANQLCNFQFVVHLNQFGALFKSKKIRFRTKLQRRENAWNFFIEFMTNFHWNRIWILHFEMQNMLNLTRNPYWMYFRKVHPYYRLPTTWHDSVRIFFFWRKTPLNPFQFAFSLILRIFCTFSLIPNDSPMSIQLISNSSNFIAKLFESQFEMQF